MLIFIRKEMFTLSPCTMNINVNIISAILEFERPMMLIIIAPGMLRKALRKNLAKVRIRMKNQNHSDHSIVKIVLNTQKSLRNMMEIAVT